MKPQLRIANVEVDTSRFDRAVKIGLEQTTRSMAEFMRTRMFYLLVRMFVLMPPRNVQTQRNRIANYLQAPLGDINKIDKKTGKRYGRRRLLRRVHLIVQARNAKAGKIALYGPTMIQASGAFMRKSLGSVGYLKSGIVKAIKKITPKFSQYGRSTGKKPFKGNAAAQRLAFEYGAEEANVSMHKGTNAEYRAPELSYKTSSYVKIVAGVADSQVGKVDAMYNATARRAFADEAAELERHLGIQVENLADQMGWEKR